MKSLFFSLFSFSAGLFLCGCHGALYTNCTYPLSQDFSSNPVGEKTVETYRHKFKEPLSGYGLNITVMTGQLDTLATEAGMKEAYYADEKVFSILFGLYERKTVVLHGK